MKQFTTVIALSMAMLISAGAMAKRPHHEPMTEEQMAAIVSQQQAAVDELDLLSTEAEQVKALIAEHAEKRAALRESVRASHEALREEYQADMGEILTEDQLDELQDAMRATMRKNWDGKEKPRF